MTCGGPGWAMVAAAVAGPLASWSAPALLLYLVLKAVTGRAQDKGG